MATYFSLELTVFFFESTSFNMATTKHRAKYMLQYFINKISGAIWDNGGR